MIKDFDVEEIEEVFMETVMKNTKSANTTLEDLGLEVINT